MKSGRSDEGNKFPRVKNMGSPENGNNGQYFTDITLKGFQEYMKAFPEFSLAEYRILGDWRRQTGAER